MMLSLPDRILWPYGLDRVIFSVVAFFSAVGLYFASPRFAQSPTLYAGAVMLLFAIEVCSFEVGLRRLHSLRNSQKEKTDHQVDDAIVTKTVNLSLDWEDDVFAEGQRSFTDKFNEIEKLYEPEYAHKVADDWTKTLRVSLAFKNHVDDDLRSVFTKRERQLLKLFSNGLTISETASIFQVTPVGLALLLKQLSEKIERTGILQGYSSEHRPTIRRR